MSLFFIDLLQRTLVDFLPLAVLIVWLGSGIFAFYGRFIRKRKLTKSLVIWVTIGPVVTLAVIAFAFWLNSTLATPRYNAWGNKCGHAPLVEVDNIIEPNNPSLYEGKNGYNQRGYASHYFCSLKDAERAGYPGESLY